MDKSCASYGTKILLGGVWRPGKEALAEEGEGLGGLLEEAKMTKVRPRQDLSSLGCNRASNCGASALPHKSLSFTGTVVIWTRKRRNQDLVPPMWSRMVRGDGRGWAGGVPVHRPGMHHTGGPARPGPGGTRGGRGRGRGASKGRSRRIGRGTRGGQDDESEAQARPELSRV